MTKQAYNKQIVTAYYTQMGLPAPVYEHLYITDRKFPLDIAFPAHKVGIECQGGIFMKHRTGHSSITGILRDNAKNNLGLLMGWRVLKLTPEELMTLPTVQALGALMGIRLKQQGVDLK